MSAAPDVTKLAQEAPHRETLSLGFRDDASLVELVTHRIAADRRRVDFEIPDMRCANCAGRIERALSDLDGVSCVRLDAARHLLVLDYDPGRIALTNIVGTISRAGYTPVFVARADDDPRVVAERRTQLKRLGVAGIAMMQVMMFTLPLYTGEALGMSAFYDGLFRWTALAFTTPVVLYSARPFFANAMGSILGWFRDPAGTAGLAMDVPVALAIAAAYIASVVATVTAAGDVYFDSVTMFTFLLLGARYLEQSTRHRLARYDNWLALLPQHVTRVSARGANGFERVPLAQIGIGDRILVHAGTRIACDAVVSDGETTVDESALTGESRPVHKRIGDTIYAGTLNLGQPMTASVRAAAIDTRMADIHRLAQRATLTKPNITVLSDVIAKHFIVAILLIAVSTYIGWTWFEPSQALYAAIAVLVVSCPCALSLATPTALTAAATALRRIGFVITRPNVIERMARTSHVVFDKTGTLTGHTAELVAVEAMADTPASTCVAIAAALESQTTHPLAAAFDAAKRERWHVQGVRVHAGKGIEGDINGVRYRLGNAEFCGTSLAPTHAELSTFYLAREHAGATATVLAEFGVEMGLRHDVRQTLDELNALGVSAEILTGDARLPAATLSRQLANIPFLAEASPEAKLERIHNLAAAGAEVVMVGDGINDVPGLAAAAVSVTTADATDLAKSTSDVVLLATGLGGIPRAIAVARRTQRVIRQNLGWALLYNLTAIPLAVAGFVPPWLAAIGMSASSLGVTLNAMRLATAPRPIRPAEIGQGEPAWKPS